jgi:hypothetical protein
MVDGRYQRAKLGNISDYREARTIHGSVNQLPFSHREPYSLINQPWASLLPSPEHKSNIMPQ